MPGLHQSTQLDIGRSGGSTLPQHPETRQLSRILHFVFRTVFFDASNCRQLLLSGNHRVTRNDQYGDSGKDYYQAGSKQLALDGRHVCDSQIPSCRDALHQQSKHETFGHVSLLIFYAPYAIPALSSSTLYWTQVTEINGKPKE